MDGFEAEYLPQWLDDMEANPYNYQEPVVDENSRNLIKFTCETLNQDIHVFVMTVDILESYISRKNKLGEVIDDPALVITTVVLICSKYLGQQELKIPHAAVYLKKITEQDYDYNEIKMIEMDILCTLNYNLSTYNQVDDLKSFIVNFEKNSKIKVSVLPLCLVLLELLYLTLPKWFPDLKSKYAAKKCGLEYFEKLMRSRFFIPIGILAYVFHSTAYINSLDTDFILKEMADRYDLHMYHITRFVRTIKSVFNN